MEVTLALIAGTVTSKPGGGWRTTTFEDAGDHTGIVGCRLRVEAAAVLAQQHPHAPVLVSGGVDQSGGPKICEVVTDELLELGVPMERIVQDGKSKSTREQLRAVGMYAQQQSRHGLVYLLSNGYHLPRIQAMVRCLDELKDLFAATLVEFISAEEVLLAEDNSRWEALITRAYASEAMNRRIDAEQQGILDLEAGSYRPRRQGV